MLPPATVAAEQPAACSWQKRSASSESCAPSFAVAQLLPTPIPFIGLSQVAEAPYLGLPHAMQCASPALLGHASPLASQEQQPRAPVCILLYDAGSELSHMMQHMLDAPQQPLRKRSFSDVRNPQVAKSAKAVQANKKPRTVTKKCAKKKPAKRPRENDAAAASVSSSAAPSSGASSSAASSKSQSSAIGGAVLKCAALLQLNRIPPYTMLMAKSSISRRAAKCLSLGLQTDSSLSQLCDSFVQTEWSPPQLYFARPQVTDQHIQTPSLTSCATAVPAIRKCLWQLNVEPNWTMLQAIMEQPSVSRAHSYMKSSQSDAELHDDDSAEQSS